MEDMPSYTTFHSNISEMVYKKHSKIEYMKIIMNKRLLSSTHVYEELLPSTNTTASS